jgi:hypothetical protein
LEVTYLYFGLVRLEISVPKIAAGLVLAEPINSRVGGASYRNPESACPVYARDLGCLPALPPELTEIETFQALEHFHFYSEQDRAAKCGFSSTPASKLAGDPGSSTPASKLAGTPVLEEKPRWARLLRKHQK